MAGKGSVLINFTAKAGDAIREIRSLTSELGRP